MLFATLESEVEDIPEPVFLCGNAAEDDTVWDCFRTVFALVADSETIRTRITQRTNNHYGKKPEELAGVLSYNSSFAEIYSARGAVLIDATFPVNKVAGTILAHAQR